MEGSLTTSDIDDDVSQTSRDVANALILKELANGNTATPHSSLQPVPDFNISELMQKEIDRVSSGMPRQGGIDLSRYEAPDEPSSDSDADLWRKTLRTAYISSAYLSGRHMNLALLEELGKNAWLIGNSQLDEILKSLDKELEHLKEETDSVNRERKTMQENSKGEILALEDTWKQGVGSLLEVQLATENLRRDTLQRKRHRPS